MPDPSPGSHRSRHPIRRDKQVQPKGSRGRGEVGGDPPPSAPAHSSGDRLLRACWILLGSGFVAVFLFILLTILLKSPHPQPDEPEGPATAQNERPTAPTETSVQDKNPEDVLLPEEPTSATNSNLARADEVERILGGGLHPTPEQNKLFSPSVPSPPLPAPPPITRTETPAPLPTAPKTADSALPPPTLPPPPPPVKADPSATEAEIEKRVQAREKELLAQRLVEAAFKKRQRASEDDLREQLLAVPELRLISDLEIQSFRETATTTFRKGVPNILPTSVDYVVSLRLNKAMRQAAVKAGLPLLSGPNCRLDPTAATIVQTLSKNLRDMGFVSVPGAFGRGAPGLGVANVRGFPIGQANQGLAQEKLDAFKEWCDINKVEKFRGALATLLQMLQVENEATRLVLVRELAKVKGPGATAALAKRAVVDLSPEVRQASVAALQKRPAGEYVPVLLQGMRYPWAPVADHAAVALLTLKPEGAVPKLVDLLDQPDPSVPVLDPKTKKGLVREMVRLNHMRNCLLCHFPSGNSNDGLVRGLVPTPGQPVPVLYYAGQSGNFVRADITFLRQDFSVNMPVKGAAPWPDEQRFDFVTRVRTIEPAKMAKIVATPGNYPQREAVLHTLRGLTGKDGGDTTAKWRDMLGLTKEKPADKTAEAK